MKARSPQYIKMSQATAISLGLARGWMYRGAANGCVNLLVYYPEGCSANCAYCGLAKRRPGAYAKKSFIHVDWPIFGMDIVMTAIDQCPSYVKRACISMITHGRALQDTLHITGQLTELSSLPVSVLLAPTILERDNLIELKSAGADKIGVALDLATKALFDSTRGSGVGGPHRWEKYWEILEAGIDIFGSPHVGAHLMVGMGETEKDMVILMERLRNMGVQCHLFSFLAEKGSAMSNRAQPPWPTYLRIQLARYLLEEASLSSEDISFDPHGRITGFGLSHQRMRDVIRSGLPFMTSGCTGDDGKVACNRPFGNCLPHIQQWNYPYALNQEELELVETGIFTENV
jgi:biotin synthase